MRVLFGVGRDYGAENPRLGCIVPSLLAVARHLLRLCVLRCLAAAYFHAGASRSLGRRLALGQDRPPFCRGYRHPVDHPASICHTRSHGEILFLVSSSRVLLTPSVAPTDDHQSRADGVPLVYDHLFIPKFYCLLVISRSALVTRYASRARGHNYIKNLVQRSFNPCVYFSPMQPLLTRSVSTCIRFPVAAGAMFGA
jgi:hypothetical protein